MVKNGDGLGHLLQCKSNETGQHRADTPYKFATTVIILRKWLRPSPYG